MGWVAAGGGGWGKVMMLGLPLNSLWEATEGQCDGWRGREGLAVKLRRCRIVRWVTESSLQSQKYIFEFNELNWSKPTYESRSQLWVKESAMSQEVSYESRSQLWVKKPAMSQETNYELRSQLWVKKPTMSQETSYESRSQLWVKKPAKSSKCKRKGKLYIQIWQFWKIKKTASSI